MKEFFKNLFAYIKGLSKVEFLQLLGVSLAMAFVLYMLIASILRILALAGIRLVSFAM